MCLLILFYYSIHLMLGIHNSCILQFYTILITCINVTVCSPLRFALNKKNHLSLSYSVFHINLLNTKRRLLYLKTQFVPRSKHFSSRL